MIGFYNYTVILTYLGFSSSILGICFAMQGKISTAVLCLMMSGLCDMFDGTVAKTRKRTRQEKNFGIQIDSLSDLVCFGVLPVVIGYNLGLNKEPYHYLILVLFTLAALIRLAYFNVCEEERQASTTEPRKYYEGLPVTCDALIIPMLYSFRNYIPINITLLYGIALVLIAVAFVTKFKLVKLKMKGMLGLLLIGILVFVWFIKEF